MSKNYHESTLDRRTSAPQKKGYEYARSQSSLQSQLISRAETILSRKNLAVDETGGIALRNIVEGTVSNIFPPAESGDLAFDKQTMKLIDKAFDSITKLMTEVSSAIKSGVAGRARSVTDRILKDVLEKLCPMTPIC